MKKSKLNILIVDDDKVTRKLVRSVLGKVAPDYVIDDVADVENMCKLIEEKNYHCIILDFFLKDITGLEILGHFKEKDIRIPVIMLTGQSDELVAVKIMQSGAYDYLPKSIIASENFSEMLKHSIANAVELYNMNEDNIRKRISLEQSEERYRSLVENSPSLILRFFPDDFMISFVNDGYCNYFNVTRFDVIGEDFLSVISDEFHKKAEEKIAQLNHKNDTVKFENKAYVDDIEKWQLWTFQALCDDKGNILEFQCIGEDITEIKHAEKKLIEQKIYIQSILDSQKNVIVVMNNLEILMVNKRFLELFGFDKLELFKKKHDCFIELINKKESSPVFENKDWLKNVIENQELENLISFNSKNSNTRKIFSISVSKLEVLDEQYVVSFADVTTLDEKSRNFEVKANFDPLTKILNRRKFSELLKDQMEMAKNMEKELSLIFFDIDHFKQVNDTFGHKSGDEVLVELSKLVSGCIRGGDIFARWGGEEFLLLLPGSNLKNSGMIADKIRKLIMERSFSDVGSVTCSFGVSQFNDVDTGETFIQRADKALYEAKESGRNRVVAIKKKVKSKT